jgi:hypothetical protein
VPPLTLPKKRPKLLGRGFGPILLPLRLGCFGGVKEGMELKVVRPVPVRLSLGKGEEMPIPKFFIILPVSILTAKTALSPFLMLKKLLELVIGPADYVAGDFFIIIQSNITMNF